MLELACPSLFQGKADMRRPMVTIARRSALAVCGIGILTATAWAQIAAPQRKAGMWETVMHIQGHDMSTQLCIDAATEAKMSVFGQQAQTESCGGATGVEKIPGGYAFHGACKGRETSGTAIGDFNSAYKVTIDSGKTHMSMDSRWLGPCPAGRRPGDMVMPGGIVINMNDVAGATGRGR
jgi:hypothetical protein